MLVFLVSFGLFAQTFQSILGHFLAILGHIWPFWVIFGHVRVILAIFYHLGGISIWVVWLILVWLHHRASIPLLIFEVGVTMVMEDRVWIQELLNTSDRILNNLSSQHDCKNCRLHIYL